MWCPSYGPWAQARRISLQANDRKFQSLKEVTRQRALGPVSQSLETLIYANLGQNRDNSVSSETGLIYSLHPFTHLIIIVIVKKYSFFFFSFSFNEKCIY